MKLTLDTAAQAQIIRVDADRIDAAVALKFKDEMRHLTSKDGDRYILDLQGVAFIDSSGLGAVVAAMKQMAPGQKLELAAMQPIVEKVFRLTRMDSIFAIHDDADQAGAGAA